MDDGSTMTHPDPQRFMDQFVSAQVASKDNKCREA